MRAKPGKGMPVGSLVFRYNGREWSATAPVNHYEGDLDDPRLVLSVATLCFDKAIGGLLGEKISKEEAQRLE